MMRKTLGFTESLEMYLKETSQMTSEKDQSLRVRHFLMISQNDINRVLMKTFPFFIIDIIMLRACLLFCVVFVSVCSCGTTDWGMMFYKFLFLKLYGRSYLHSENLPFSFQFFIQPKFYLRDGSKFIGYPGRDYLQGGEDFSKNIRGATTFFQPKKAGRRLFFQTK